MYSPMMINTIMSRNYDDKLHRSIGDLKEADAILIGGGAGLSASAGLLYDGKRFDDNFAEYIKKYSLTDMYSSGFYPFKTQEEKWGYWSRHIKINRFDPAAADVYLNLRSLVKDKEHFVITTNVDGQFYKAGFDPTLIFGVQGDYGKLQCAVSCHPKLYDNEQLVRQMVAEQENCRIPSSLVPVCPKCGGNMDANLRKDNYFIENETWHQSSLNYQRFLSGLGNKKVVLLEIGVGYNTPSIIKFPFEEITSKHPNVTLIRMNRDLPQASVQNKDKTIVFKEDAAEVIKEFV